MRFWIYSLCIFIVLLLGLFVFTPFGVMAEHSFQEATQTMPTVTGTPSGPIVTVRSDGESFVNVRSGPGLFYDKIGVLLTGQQLSAKGRSSGGDWILVDYPGVEGGVAWVYASFVNISPGALSIVEPPPTPTAQVTSTIDPTLAAQFIKTVEATRLPTFTDSAPLVIATYEASDQQGLLGNIPIGMVIVSFAALGILLMLFVLTQGR